MSFRSTPPVLRAALTLALCAGPGSAQARPALRFEDFPAGSPFTGRSRLLLRGPVDWAHRTRLRTAARQSSDFAGHYRMALWGCGAECVHGAAIDLRSGRITWLPGTICCWFSGESAAAQDTEPVLYRRNSQLIVLSGMRNERENDLGRHYYRIDGNRFTLVADRPMTPFVTP